MKIGIRFNGAAVQQPFADVCKWAASVGIAAVEDAGFNQNGSGIIAIELEDDRYWKDCPNYQEGVRHSVECLKKFAR